MSHITLGAFEALTFYILGNNHYWGLSFEQVDEHILAFGMCDAASENQVTLYAINHYITPAELPALYERLRAFDEQKARAAHEGDPHGLDPDAYTSCIGIAISDRRRAPDTITALTEAYRALPFDLDLVVVPHELFERSRTDSPRFPFLQRH